MAVLKQTSPTACPVAPSPKPSRTVPSANTSSAVALGSSQVLPEAFAGDWVMRLLLAYYIVRGKGPSDSAPNRVNIETKRESRAARRHQQGLDRSHEGEE